MSRPSEDEFARLQRLAYEISEELDANGFRVDQALGRHPAFNDGRAVTSVLERSIIKFSAARAASVAGVFPRKVSGGLEILSSDDGIFRSYRMKLARRRQDGSIDLVCGANSALLRTSEPEGLFERAENWILGCILTSDHHAKELFVGEIVDWVGENPVHLKLGAIIPLLPVGPPPGFTSDEEDDLGLDDLDEGDVDVA
jgi:hypothetical protein